jgi:hypothetical protein
MYETLVSSTTANAAADPDGTWKWKFTRQGGEEIEMSLKLEVEGEKLTGSLILPMGDKIEIEKGAFKDDEVTFETTMKRNGNTFKAKYKGKVEGDMIKGKTERERNGEVVMRDWEAKRERK